MYFKELLYKLVNSLLIKMLSGIAYITSNQGKVRAAIILLGFITFVLVMISGFPEDVIKWVMSAYFMTWCCSLFSFIIITTNLSSKFQCKVSYKTVDVCLSIVCCFYCLMATIVLTMYLRSQYKILILADIFGIILSSLYAVEVYFFLRDIPENLQYLKTKNGILKIAICVTGCATFTFLDASGYRCYYPDGCDAARTWALAAFIYCWSVSLILFLLRTFGFDSKISFFNQVDFVWSMFSLFNYLTAACLVSYYMYCPAFDGRYCVRRLFSVVSGIVTVMLYMIQVYFLKDILIEKTLV